MIRGFNDQKWVTKRVQRAQAQVSQESGDPSVGWKMEPLLTLFFVYRSTEQTQRLKRDAKLQESDKTTAKR